MTRFISSLYFFSLWIFLTFTGPVSASAWIPTFATDVAQAEANTNIIEQTNIASTVTDSMMTDPPENLIQKSSEPEPGFVTLDALTQSQRGQLQMALDGILANRQKLDEVRCHYHVVLGPMGPNESKYIVEGTSTQPTPSSTAPSDTTLSNEEKSKVDTSSVLHEGVWLHSASRQATCLTLQCDPSVIETNRRARNAWVSVFFDDSRSSETNLHDTQLPSTEVATEETPFITTETQPNPSTSFADYRPCYAEQFLQYKNNVFIYSELINTGNLYTDSLLSPLLSGTPFDARVLGTEEQESPTVYLRQILDGTFTSQWGQTQIKIEPEIKFNGLTGWRLTIQCDLMRWECTFVPERDWLPIRFVQQPSNKDMEIPLTAAVMEVVEFGQMDTVWYPKRLISISSRPQDVPLLAAWYEVDSLACGDAAAITDETFDTDFSLSLPMGAKLVHFEKEEPTPNWLTLSSDIATALSLPVESSIPPITTSALNDSSTKNPSTIVSSVSTNIPSVESAMYRISVNQLSALAEQIRIHGKPPAPLPQASESSSDEQNPQERIREELRQLAEEQTAKMDPNAIKRRIYGNFLDDPKNQTTVVFCTVCTILIIVGIRLIMRRRAMKKKNATQNNGATLHKKH